MELKPGYKQTEVGVIPEDWGVKAISGIAPLQRGFDLPIRNISEGLYPIVYSNGIEGTHSVAMAKGPGVVTGRSGTLGKVHFVEYDYWPHNTSLWVTRFNGNNSKFIYYLYCFLRFERFASGSGVPTLNRNDIHSYRVALPQSHDEQRAIATALSDMDALLDGLDRLIDKKRAIKQATMQQLLTGQTRLPGFSGAWEVRSLLEIAEYQKTLFDDGDWVEAEHITDEGIRLVQTGNIGVGQFLEKGAKKYIYESSFEKLKCKELKVGDILICRLAEPAGRACILPDIGEGRIITSVDVTIFRPLPGTADRNFLIQVFSTDEWFRMVLDQVGGTTHKRISRGSLGKLKVPFPCIKEQQAIATILTDMDAEITALETRHAKIRALKQAMMQELLTGRTRLV